ncbi:MAG: hypothetical protein IKK89_04790 [Alistipes sp.]|nr:hypothetical protein [Alistipes sp.]MBR6631244.1 hypothetical protein [Alistipes sp.]
MTNNQEIRAFRKGLREMSARYDALRSEIMAALGIKNRVSFGQYADGKLKLDVAKAQKIEQVFHKYGIEKPWGLPIES